MEEIHNVNVRGTEYQVVELLHVRRDRINPLNLAKLKRGAEYHEYRLLGSEDFTLKIYEHEYDALKEVLKGIPDNRSFDERHPYYQPTAMSVNVIISILGYFI